MSLLGTSTLDKLQPSDVVAFVHAKGTSERLPGKNLANLGGIPLVAHAVKAAVAAEMVGRVVIDSDSDEILDVGKAYGAEPLKRPKELATNATTGDDLAYWQARHARWAKMIVQVVPTCPFTRPETIDSAVAMIGKCHSTCASVFSDRLYRWGEVQRGFLIGRLYNAGWLPDSKTLSPTVWETTGLYAMRTTYVLENRRRINETSGVCVEVSRIEAIDINTQADLDFARIVHAGMLGLGHTGRDRNKFSSGVTLFPNAEGEDSPLLARLTCVHCRRWLSDHCTKHTVPCCPGKCSAEEQPC